MKRITSLFLALISSVLLLCSATQTAQAAPANPVAGNGHPYYIMVNRALNAVTVYELDEDGYYTVPVKVMVCSVGREGHATPTGTFSIGGKWTWVHMLDNSYGQYVSQISGNILFHSVCYTKRDPSTLMTFEYNALGERASLGCVRLQSGDAKWIYDNCARGTKVTIYDDFSSPSPLGKPERAVDFITESMDNGWDPTDPREENPWRTVTPYADVLSGAWYFDDVRYVLQAGLMTGVSATKFDPNGAVTYREMAELLHKLSGAEGSDAMTWASDSGLLDDMTGSGFNIDGPISRQGLVTMLYRYETDVLGSKADKLAVVATYKDYQAIRSYARTPMRWAVGNGLVQGTANNTINPTAKASRAQLAAILHRYDSL